MKPFFLFAGIVLLVVAMCSGAIGGFTLYQEGQDQNLREVTFAELASNPPKVGEKFKLTDAQLFVEGYFMVTNEPATGPAEEDPESWGSAYIPVVAPDSPADETVLGFEYILSSSKTQDHDEIVALADEPFVVCTIQRARLSEELEQYQPGASAEVLLSFPETDVDTVMVLRHGTSLSGTGAGWACAGTGLVIGVLALIAMAIGLFLPKPAEPQPYAGGHSGGQPTPRQDDVWPGAGGASSSPSPTQQVSPFASTPPPPPPAGWGDGQPPAEQPSAGAAVPNPFGNATTPPVPAPPMQSMYAPPANSGFAIASLICGIGGLLFCCFILPSVAAVITGHVALGQIKRGQGRVGGKGMAIAGLITGYLGLVGGILYIITVIISAATQNP
ncbi:MAG: DUF4190 domain-containing protein [Phycisphaerales bacterium JB063]